VKDSEGAGRVNGEDAPGRFAEFRECGTNVSTSPC
jgi:hypothetical protein